MGHLFVGYNSVSGVQREINELGPQRAIRASNKRSFAMFFIETIQINGFEPLFICFCEFIIIKWE